MKKIFLLSFLLLSIFSVPTFATPVEGFNGRFTIDIGKHDIPINGSIHLFFEGDSLALVKIKTDKPIFKKTEFDSTEQKLVVLENAGVVTQFSAAYKVKFASHSWYFVFVTNPTDKAGVFAGKFFKAPAPLDGILAILNQGVDLSGAVPNGWKLVGSGSLTDLGIVEDYSGTFTWDHSIDENPINGSIHLFFKGPSFSHVKINTDQPVSDKTEFESIEQKLVVLENEGVVKQFSVVYKLRYPEHPWYFAFVTNPTENAGSFAGTFFKVPFTMDEIVTVLNNGINLACKPPTDWKVIGTGTLIKTGSLSNTESNIDFLQVDLHNNCQ